MGHRKRKKRTVPVLYAVKGIKSKWVRDERAGDGQVEGRRGREREAR